MHYVKITDAAQSRENKAANAADFAKVLTSAKAIQVPPFRTLAQRLAAK